MSLKVVRSLLAEQLGYSDENEITKSLSLFDDLNMDGNDFDEVIAALEDQYEIEFSEDDLDEIETVGDLVAMVGKLSED